MTDRIFQEGQKVRVRNTWGTFTIRRILLTRGEVELEGARGVRRHVPVDQLVEIIEGDAK